MFLEDDEKKIEVRDGSLEVTSLLEKEEEQKRQQEEEEANRDALLCAEKTDEGSKESYERLHEKAHDPLMDQKEEQRAHWSQAWFDFLIERVNHYHERKKEMQRKHQDRVKKREDAHQHEVEIFAFLRGLTGGKDKGKGNGRDR